MTRIGVDMRQEQVDHYWDALTADGGQPGQCGWLEDKYGVSWQVVPNLVLGEN
jgi:predicted 3-demethylubiquinone-9 3-methyltransferase (glyoxalase superfamily)